MLMAPMIRPVSCTPGSTERMRPAGRPPNAAVKGSPARGSGRPRSSRGDLSASAWIDDVALRVDLALRNIHSAERDAFAKWAGRGPPPGTTATMAAAARTTLARSTVM